MHTDQACRPAVALLFVMTLPGAPGCGGGNGPEAIQTADEAITSGALDPGDPAVVRLEGGFSPCTGTLITARVVLTAAHCVEEPPTTVFFGADSAGAGDRVAVIAQAAHPDFDPILVQNDVALVLLERPAAVAPVPWLASAPTGTWVGAEVRLVGFGRTEPGDLSQNEKRTGTAWISAAGDTDLLCAPDPSLPCLGDSGGPVLAGDQVIGIVSSGDPGCSDHARAMRVDAYGASFIAPQLAAWDAPAPAGGGCGVSGSAAGAVSGAPLAGRWGALLVVVACIVAARLQIYRPGARPCAI